MRKIVLTVALAALTLASSVSANWITGEPTILAVNAGEAAFHTALTSDQRLDVNLIAGMEGKADLTFTTKASESELALSALSALPVLVSEEGGYADAKLTITPLVNDANGLRFYLVDTGEAGGAHIVSYKGGTFKNAFDAADLENINGASSFTVEKKQIFFHTKENGTDATYTLSLDTKSLTFTAVK